jgi:hypothetical protein
VSHRPSPTWGSSTSRGGEGRTKASIEDFAEEHQTGQLRISEESGGGRESHWPKQLLLNIWIATINHAPNQESYCKYSDRDY